MMSLPIPSWDDYPLLGVDEAARALATSEYFALPDDGLRAHALFCWVAGPLVVARRPAVGGNVTLVRCWDEITQTWNSRSEPRTDYDQKSIDDAVDGGFQAAGVNTQRPRGCEWMVKTSTLKCSADDVKSALDKANNCPEPHEALPLVQEVAVAVIQEHYVDKDRIHYLPDLELAKKSIKPWIGYQTEI